jgi:LysR family glycine cleavage system transcriptional activator
MVEKNSTSSSRVRALRNFPSLNALRAFEAVARLRSFAQAADELHVTPGAVSHQIAGLEDTLGVVLFRRDARAVTLTPAAEAGLGRLTQGFDALREAVRLFQTDGRARSLAIRVAPAFATRWFLPRLTHFTERHPDIDLRVSTDSGLIDASRGEAPPPADVPDHGLDTHLAIRFGRGRYPGQRVDRLFATTTVTPVCSPRLLGGVVGAGIDELRHHLLLHDDTVYFDGGRPDWEVWLDAAGATGIDASRGPRFGHTGLALDAAADGVGVALGIPLLVASDVASGRLVAPFPLRLPSPYAYFLVCPEASAESPEVVAFRAWLRDEVAATIRERVDDGAEAP